jgi:hypothetical protein
MGAFILRAVCISVITLSIGEYLSGPKIIKKHCRWELSIKFILNLIFRQVLRISGQFNKRGKFITIIKLRPNFWTCLRSTLDALALNLAQKCSFEKQSSRTEQGLYLILLHIHAVTMASSPNLEMGIIFCQ